MSRFRHPSARRYRHARLFAPACLVFLILIAASLPASAQETLRGAALVIGNGEYEHLAPLANPPDDADAIEELLADLGFDSVRRTDRDAEDLARDLERFVEDAEDADVAVLYYAGHGVEAGGENWLVPVDADISALESAAERLVPVSGIIRRLRQTVPVTIVLLDACRDNPFPDGALLKTAANADPVPLSAGGLTVTDTRGAGSLAKTVEPSAANDNLGIVIGFAAAPGQVALDGTKGENSPYAAALIRHIAAMAGEEFGTVMRMVAEEVYLRTNGAQRPWVNESLRRLLYFGEAPDPLAGPEGDILTERRSLLLTISALPDVSRKQVERVAGRGGVPMDAVYAMLKALGADTPDDPVELEKLLRSKADELKAFLAERRVIENPDPELARLSALSEEAVSEGALDTARRLRSEIDRRITELSAVIEREEDLIRARRTEFAAEYAKSAEVAVLTFDYAAAASDYEKAYEQIVRWDDRLAWEYRKMQIEQLLSHNNRRGDPESLRRAVGLARGQLDAAADIGEFELAESRLMLARALFQEAQAQRNFDGYFGVLDEVDAALAGLHAGEKRARALRQRGTILANIGANLAQPAQLDEAISAYRQALAEISREEHSDLWLDLQGDLGSLLGQVAMLTLDAAPLREAISVFEEAKDLAGDEDPVKRMFFQMQLAMFRIALPEMQNPDEVTAETADAVIAELAASKNEIVAAQFPLAVGLLDHSIGMMQVSKADLGGHDDVLEQAVGSFRSALQYRRRDTAPGEWAETNEQLAFTLRRVAARTENPRQYREALDAFENALTVYRPGGAMPRWAPLQAGLVGATRELGLLEDDTGALQRAAKTARVALSEPALDQVPDLRFDISQELVWTLWELYSATGDLAHLEEQVSVFDAELADIDANERQADYLDAHYIIADAASRLGRERSDARYLRRSADSYERVLELHDRADRNHFGFTSYDAGKIYIAIADGEDRPEALQKALFHLGQAAEHIDVGEYPISYAHALSDRSTIFHRLFFTGKDPRHFEQARAGYQEAIGIYESHDRASQALHLRNLGLLYLIHDDQSASLGLHPQAVAAFRSAVEANIAAGARAELFRSAYQLGNALTDLARGTRDNAYLREAAAAFSQAAGVSPPDVPPADWADAQHQLGLSLYRLGVVENDPDSLEKSQTAFRTALQVQTPESDFISWIDTQDSLADTLTELALRSDGTDHLQKALVIYDAMIARYPSDWPAMGAAELRMKRGNMLRMIGERGGGIDNLRAAADGYREALDIAGNENEPDFLIGVGQNLGRTLERIARATGDMAVYREAANAFRAVVDRMPAEGNPQQRAVAQRELGLTLSTLGDAGNDMAALEEAIAALSAATGHITKDANPADWAYLTNNIAWLEIVAGRRQGAEDRFEHAAEQLREVVALQRDIGDTQNLGFSEDSLCAALYELGAARNEKSLLEDAVAACTGAIAHLRQHGYDSVTDGTRKLLAEANDALMAAD